MFTLLNIYSARVFVKRIVVYTSKVSTLKNYLTENWSGVSFIITMKIIKTLENELFNLNGSYVVYNKNDTLINFM